VNSKIVGFANDSPKIFQSAIKYRPKKFEGDRVSLLFLDFVWDKFGFYPIIPAKKNRQIGDFCFC